MLLSGAAAIPSSTTLECITGNLTHCIKDSLSQVVNNAITNGTNKVNYSLSMSAPAAPANSAASPMSLTINDCAKILEDRLVSFQDFSSKADDVWNDVVQAQETMVNVEAATQSVLKAESQFGSQMEETNVLFQDATDRCGALGDWVDGEKVVRNQLTELYTALDQRVLSDSEQVVVTVSGIRDALTRMQKVHDHATKILTAVGDAESTMYEWAYNVSTKVNTHTVNLVSIAQTLQYRSSQINAVKDANVNLHWIISQITKAHGEAKIKELNDQFESGQLKTPAGNATLPAPATTATTAKIPAAF